MTQVPSSNSCCLQDQRTVSIAEQCLPDKYFLLLDFDDCKVGDASI